MAEKVIKSNVAPPGVYQHVHSGVRIRVDFQEYKKPLPAKKNAYTEIGEVVVLFVNIVGWFVLAVTLLVGILNVIMVLIPGTTTEEVTIEQAE